MAQQSTQPHPYTRDIAAFVSGLTYDKIPEEVRHRNKLLMLDSLGCALYGADLEWTRILQDKLSSIDLDASRTAESVREAEGLILRSMSPAVRASRLTTIE